MLGLTVDHDRSNLRSLVAGAAAVGVSGGPFDTSIGANARSQKFAAQLAGRFFVSGVSGGFEKHARKEKLAAAGGDAVMAPTKPKLSEEIFKQRQAREIREDAKRLMQMEEQLREIQRKKELRRQRDRERRRKKLEYVSACRIQRAVRYFFGTKLRNAVDTIVEFIRVNKATQALAIGAWAAGVIRRFAVSSSIQFLQRRNMRIDEERAAFERWSQMQKAMDDLRNARRNTSNSFVGNCVKQGFMRALALRIKEIRANMQKRVIGKSPNKKASLGSVKTPVKRPSPKGEAHLQFFLTEFDSGVPSTVESPESPVSPLSLSSIPTSTPHKQQEFVNRINDPELPSRSIGIPVPIAVDSVGFNVLSDEDLRCLLQPEEDNCDEDVFRRQRIQSLHEERQRRMQKERQHRLAKLEQSKRQHEAETEAKAIKEAEEAREREEAKKSWMQRYEHEQIKKARCFAKAAAEKNRQRKLEEKELAAMLQEDPLLLKKQFENRRRPAVPRFSKPSTNSKIIEEAARKEQEDILAAELKRKQQAEIMARAEAALRQRLLQQKQREILAKQQHDDWERTRAEQKAKVAADAQARLIRALELKQLALERGEVADPSVDQDKEKDNSNAKVKEKGKSRKDCKGRSSKKVGKAPPRSADSDATDGIPAEHMAAIVEWNHQVLPPKGSSAKSSGGKDDFQFDEFILHAEKAVIVKRPLTESAPATAPTGDGVEYNSEIAEPSNNQQNCDEDVDHESTLEINDDLNQHTFADMLDDDSSHYDWLEAFQVDTMGAEGEAEGLADLKLLDTDFAWEEETNSPLLPHGAENVPNGKHPKKTKSTVKKPPHFKRHEKVPTVSRAAPADADTVSHASSNNNTRSLNIPPSLKETPYYHAYVRNGGVQSVVEQSEKTQAARATKKGGAQNISSKQRKGKVAELLEMVAKARKKLGREVSVDVPESADPTPLLFPNAPSSILSAPKLVLSPKWRPPPPVEYFFKGRISSKNKPLSLRNVLQPKSSVDSSTYAYDIYEMQRSLESLDHNITIGEKEVDSDNSEAEEAQAERKLNAECTELRQRLEDKIGVAISEGHIKSPMKRSNSLPSGSLTAANALNHMISQDETFENSMAAALLQQWAEEDLSESTTGI